ncbi:O-antigen ligase family protein [Vibrio furnissii]|uniref:O-antigen ligase family protein n=2 Tax=Vibrio furnissii TaxID=29494 RepID=UPI001C9DE7AD|nr:O-antigen ligase family protein [Vibrio furnissii]MBY7959044.1 O-antigen ligase family protein [Vibrio fluvialis]WJG21738.1 O-antigen ligase family protein [Vibrio furnissii]
MPPFIPTLSLMTSLLSATFFASLTLTPESYSFAALLIAFLSLVLIPKTFRVISQPSIQVVSISLLLFWLLYLFAFLYHKDPISSIDLPSRALLAIFSMWLFLTYPPRLAWIMVGISLGAISSGIIAIIQTYYFHLRAFNNSGYMVIQIGGICAWLAALSTVSFIYFQHQSNKRCSYIALAAAGFALSASLLSGARGSWVPTPFVLIAILWIAKHYVNRTMLISLLMVWSMAFIISAPQIDHRVNAVVSDLSQYENENAASSSGIRLELWKSALYAAAESPLVGYGHDGLTEVKKAQIARGLVDSIVIDFSRAHNQFLEELQTKGIIGLFGIILVFAIPFFLFVRKLFSTKAKENTALFFASMLGCTHVLMVSGFCLTQHYLNHHSGILMYSFGTAIFAALVLHFNKSASQA